MAREMNKNCDLFISIPDYGDENISDKVVMIIKSYKSIVNTIVWRKERWVIKYFLKIKKTDVVCYLYSQRNTSLMHQKTEKRM